MPTATRTTLTVPTTKARGRGLPTPSAAMLDVLVQFDSSPTRARALESLALPAPRHSRPEAPTKVPSRHEDWAVLAQRSPVAAPDRLDRDALDDLSPRERAVYNLSRRRWHANMGTLPTPQMSRVHQDIWDIVETNQHTGEKVRGPIAIDGPPGHGKTTIASAFLIDFHNLQMLQGATVDGDHDRIPIVRISLQDKTTTRELGVKMCEFMGLPTGGSSLEVHLRALDAMARCDTQILFIDELQFLSMEGKAGRQRQNYFKFLANEFPVTLIFAGHGIREMNSILEGGNRDAAREQTKSRWTYLDVAPFKIDTEENRLAWWELLLNIEHRLRLADGYRGMLSEEFADYVYARTQGRIQSVFTLINRAAGRAIRTGEERLTRELLDAVKIEEVVDEMKDAHLLALDDGFFRSKPSNETRSEAAAWRRAEKDAAEAALAECRDR